MAGFTVTQLEAIETAIASGELTVNYEGKSVTYRSMQDLIAARDLIRGELIAASLSVGEITDYLNVDSLAYLDLDRLKAATGAVGAGFCDACFSGDYPIPLTDAENAGDKKQKDLFAEV